MLCNTCANPCKYGYHYDCPNYKSKDVGKQTNEEWFCGLSTEDKAVFLSVEAARAISEYENNDTKRTGMNFWKYWLKAVHKDDNS